MSRWLIPAFLLVLLQHWSFEQEEQICHHIDAKDYMYKVQCYGLNQSNAVQLTLVMRDVRLKFPRDRMKVQVGNSFGDAIPDDVFDGFVIEYVGLTNCGFTSIPFNVITKLPHYLAGLDLSSNAISTIDFQRLNALPYTSSITHLELNSNKIASLTEDAFANFTSLMSLSLKDNLLEGLADYTFRGLVKLHALYLYGNHITNVGSEAFADLEELEFMALELNNIDFFKEGTFSVDKQTKLSEIPLEGNPFHCNCSLQWLKDYLHSIHYLVSSGATCTFPQIAKFTDIDFCNS